MSPEWPFTILAFVVGLVIGLIIRHRIATRGALVTRQRRTKVRDGIDDREDEYNEEKKETKSKKDKKLRSL